MPDITAAKKDDTVPIDINIPDNYVEHTLKTTRPLPPISWENWYKEINWLSFTILTLTPVMGVIGAFFVKLRWETFLFSIFYYYVTGLGGLSINSWQKCAILMRKKGLRLATTVCGPIGPTTRRSHFSTSSL